MKLIENNYKKEYEITCCYCDSKLSYTNEDIKTTAVDKYVDCPACHQRIYIENSEPLENELTPAFKPPYLCTECYNKFTGKPYIAYDGSLFAKCPKCGNEEWVGDGVTLTKDNIEFPLHFYQYGKRENSVHISDNEVTERIRRCIKSIENNNIDFSYYMSGDTCIVVFINDDNEVCVVVGQNYYETNVHISANNF